MSNDFANADAISDVTTLQEQLVAYLDGELDDEASRQVEALLAANPKVREALTRLELTWEALDRLGRAEVDETFTQTTLEMVAVAAEGDVQQQEEEAPRKKRRRWLIGGGALLATGAAGFLFVMLFWPDPDQELLEALPVLQNLDQYQQIESVEFLEMLYDKDLFPEAEDEAQ
jgi:anti-sigma factor RsiW